MTSRIMFAGDTHGDTMHVTFLIDHAVKTGADAVFVLGDFGIWNHADQGKFIESVNKRADRAGVRVYFLPGNHDNYDVLAEWEQGNERDGDGFVRVLPNLHYSPRGHRWTWGGVRFMSLGGAYSVDKDWRTEEDEKLRRSARVRREMGMSLNARQRYIEETGHYLWWPQEEITDDELEFALRPGEVDVLLTHDKPRASNPGWNRKDLIQCHPNQDKIQAVVNAKRPKLLLHGHLHHPYEQVISERTLVKSLDCNPDAHGNPKLFDKTESYVVISLIDGKYEMEKL